MILGITSHTKEYLEKHPECKTAIYSEGIGKTISKCRKGIGKAVLLGAMLSTDPAHSQEVKFLEADDGNNSEISYSGFDIEQEKRNISILLRAAQAGFDIEDFKYEMTVNPEIRDHIYVLSSPVVLYTTKAISGDFFNRTGYQLEMIDIISIARLVESRTSFASDPLLFEERYLDVISHYPDHEVVLGELFGKYLSKNN